VAIEGGAPAFPVVGVGASAGGLEAFEELVGHVPVDSGMAFVLVPHLDPSHVSILGEILQRAASIPVLEATDQLPVAPNCIYVIPPNRDMAIFHGRLQLSIPPAPHGARMPIDAFLRSLAEDQGENAYGVILSGTGTDGTLGLRAILGAGGVTVVQEPSTAKYDGMPSSAIKAGYATHVLPPGEIPGVLQRQAHAPATAGAPVLPSVAGGMDQVLMVLRSKTGHDFSQYKRSTVGRRVERRMGQHGIEDLRVYARYLKENPAEVKLLFKELLINVTSFFRDPEAFEALRLEVLPTLVADKPEGYVVRVWVAGCATGEEAYSLAILLREFIDDAHRDCRVQIYATDLDDEAIAIARAGGYPPNIVQDVSPERLRRFFVKEESGYRVKKEIREMVVFAVQNAVKDPPFTRLDLACCRNLLIYLQPELQERLIGTLHYALRPGGVLFLSPSESIGNHTELFTPVNRRWKLYRTVPSNALPRLASTRSTGWTEPPEIGSGGAPPSRKDARLADTTRHALLQAYGPASVLTDLSGNILYVHGNTGRYLSPAIGRATLNVIDMAHDGLQSELRGAFQDPASWKNHVLARELLVRTDGRWQPVLLAIRAVAGEDSAGLALVSFQEIAPPALPVPRSKRGASRSESRRARELARALAHSQELLRTTTEEQQANTEEFKSINEELQSTNEELQSTNEELETSREELQSVNEELVTVNGELQAKVEQLARVQNDMRNLFDSIGVGTVFLDDALGIRRFTREATRIFRAIPSDVGRPLADIKSDLPSDELLAGARSVLDTLVPWERELTTADGTSYLTRIQPYRTLDNVIEGVVMTFTDISARVRAEGALQDALVLAQSMVDTVREPLLVLDEGMRIASASRAFYEQFRVTPQETIGHAIYEIGERQWDVPALRQLLETTLERDRAFDGYVVEHDFPRIGHRRVVLNARRIARTTGKTKQILLAMESVPEGATPVP
jgi:two-component system CheB/CheR fusion protein